jgi:Flp pilus assembly pilin Flp
VVECIRRIRDDDSGQDLAEYAILISLIAVFVIVALEVFGPAVSTAFNDVSSELP